MMFVYKHNPECKIENVCVIMASNTLKKDNIGDVRQDFQFVHA